MALGVEIPFFVDFQNVKEAGAGLKKAVGDSGKAAGKALSGSLTTAIKKVGKSFDGLEEKADKFASLGGKAARVPLPGFALLGDAVDRVGQTISLLSNPIGVAIASFGALFAAVTASVGAVVLGTAAVVGLVAASGELEKAIKGLEKIEGFGISKADSENLENARTAMASLGSIVAQGSLEIASMWAPAIERVTVLLLAFGLAAVDAFSEARKGVGSFHALMVESVQNSITAYNPLFKVLKGLVRTLEFIGVVAAGSAKKLEAVTNELLETATLDVLSKTEAGLVSVELAAGQYLSRAEELVQTQKDLNQEMVKTADIKPFLTAAEGWQAIADAQIEAQTLLRDFETQRMSQVQLINEEYRIQAEQIQELIKLGADEVALTQLQIDLLEERNQKLAAAQAPIVETSDIAEEWAARQAEILEDTIKMRAVMKGTAKVMGGMSALLDEIAGQQKGIFIASKALSIGEILLNGAVATIRAFAELGPVGGALAAAGVIASTIASSLATAKSVTAEFATGGIARASGGGVVDGGGNPRVSALLEDREGVLNQRAMGILGADNLQRLNEGVSPKPPPSPRIYFRDRDIAHLVGRTMDGANELGDRVRNMQGPVGVLQSWTV